MQEPDQSEYLRTIERHSQTRVVDDMTPALAIGRSMSLPPQPGSDAAMPSRLLKSESQNPGSTFRENQRGQIAFKTAKGRRKNLSLAVVFARLRLFGFPARARRVTRL